MPLCSPGDIHTLYMCVQTCSQTYTITQNVVLTTEENTADSAVTLLKTVLWDFMPSFSFGLPPPDPTVFLSAGTEIHHMYIQNIYISLEFGILLYQAGNMPHGKQTQCLYNRILSDLPSSLSVRLHSFICF